MSTLHLLVCALGNSGSRHARMRHNTGVLILEALIERTSQLTSTSLRLEKDLRSRGWRTDDATVRVGDAAVCLSFYRPGGAMNQLRIPPALQHLTPVVIHDELDHGFGVVRRRFGGSHGGHNGLRSISASLGSSAFWRLRIGIGQPASRDPGEITRHVLGNFAPEQLKQLSSDVADVAWVSLAAVCADVLAGKETTSATPAKPGGPAFEAP